MSKIAEAREQRAQCKEGSWSLSKEIPTRGPTECQQKLYKKTGLGRLMWPKGAMFVMLCPEAVLRCFCPISLVHFFQFSSAEKEPWTTEEDAVLVGMTKMPHKLARTSYCKPQPQFCKVCSQSESCQVACPRTQHCCSPGLVLREG